MYLYCQDFVTNGIDRRDLLDVMTNKNYRDHRDL